MVVKFGENAGLVWNALNAGKKTAKEIKKATKLTDKMFYAALGWLAREGKVSIEEVDGELVVVLI